jgi:hypothetical protein
VGCNLTIPTEVRQPKLTSCTCLYPNSAGVKVCFGTSWGFDTGLLGTVKGWILPSGYFVVCHGSGRSPFGGGLCSTLMRNDE